MMRMASDHDEEHQHDVNDDGDKADLGDEELGDPLGEATLLRRENHLQHVTWIETLCCYQDILEHQDNRDNEDNDNTQNNKDNQTTVQYNA